MQSYEIPENVLIYKIIPVVESLGTFGDRKSFPIGRTASELALYHAVRGIAVGVSNGHVRVYKDWRTV